MKKLTLLLLFVLMQSTFVQAEDVPTEDPPHGPLHPMLAEVIEAGPYQAQWKSLVKHPVPEWFVNDKIGLSAHWGPYATPGWTPRKDTPYGVAYAEWYWQWLKINDAVKAHHKEFYGDAEYDDFIDGTKNLVTAHIEFNIGPKPDGTLPVFELERLAAMNEWLEVNGDAVYGTRKGVLKNLSWGRSTTKDTTLYLHVFDWPSNSTLTLQGLVTRVKKAYLLHDSKRQPLTCIEKEGERLSIDLSGQIPFKYASVIVLELASNPVVNNRIFLLERP